MRHHPFSRIVKWIETSITVGLTCFSSTKIVAQDSSTVVIPPPMGIPFPGRISSIVNIHNPSIEVHMVDRGINTGAAVILAAGGGHRTLNVWGESADFVPYFYNYGINTIILRNRLRSDGYVAETDPVNDAFESTLY